MKKEGETKKKKKPFGVTSFGERESAKNEKQRKFNQADSQTLHQVDAQ